jgi:hypothetical protein
MNKPINRPRPKTIEHPESEHVDEGTKLNTSDLEHTVVSDDIKIEEGDYFDPPIFDEEINFTEIDFVEDTDPFLNETSPEIEEPEYPNIPSSQSSDDFSYEFHYHSDRSYFFIFGPSTSGKTVIISSIIRYLKSYRNRKHGDTLKNINNDEIVHEKEGNRLWKELTETNINNEFPKGTSVVGASKIPIPRHLNLHFIPSNGLPDLKFCFMDMAGEDLSKIDYDSYKTLPKGIKTYIEDVENKNLCFIYVLNPDTDLQSKANKVSLFEAFIDLLDKNEHTNTPLLLLVSKWDKIRNNYTSVDEYLEKEFDTIWGRIHEKVRDITIAEFSIGEVDSTNKNLIKYDPGYAERVFNWMYKNQMGRNLDGSTDHEPLNFFEKILKYFKGYE